MSAKDPIELLRSIYSIVDNGHKTAVKEAVESIKEMQAELADLKSSLTRQPLPEAPTSVNFRMVHVATQTESQFTLRGYTDVELQERLQHRISSLVDSGWVAFDVYVDQRRAERGQGQPPAPPQAIPGTPPLAVVTPPQSQPHQSLTFQAKTLAATVNDGKAYWKVKGGKFEKFGVTVWPEVLEEAGFFMDNLSPMDVYNLAGYTATYTIKDDGKAEKVTKLTKAA